MLPAEKTAEIQYLTRVSQVSIPDEYNMIMNTNMNMNMNVSSLEFSRFLLPGGYEQFTPQSSSISNNSTSDESIIDERKQRRMVSNRESARRSRMRKQKHLDELWSQVVRLRTENHSLMDKLNHVSECHDQVVRENARLKEEASDLQQMLHDLRINTPYLGLESSNNQSPNHCL